MSPKISVLMPVYNGERFLREAVESILNQTYRDFEFLIINDGSTDGSAEIIESYKDPRIRLVHNERNIKLIGTLNKGLELAHGQYIARMDCDDVSLPERLSRQVSFMDANPDIGICGTWIKGIGDIKGTRQRYPVDPEVIKCRLLFECVLAHPSVMMRREMMIRNNLRYDDDYSHAEDIQLWQRASRTFLVSNIAEELVLYRSTGQSVSRIYRDTQAMTLKRIDKEAIERLGISPNPEELTFHRCLDQCNFKYDRKFIEGAEAWLIKLHEANRKSPYYSQGVFEKVLAERLFLICNVASGLGFWAWRFFRRSPLSVFFDMDLKRNLKFMAKCAIRHRAVLS